MGASVRERWSLDKAKAWGEAQPWVLGCNFTPSTASNQLEFWQEASFDPETLMRELGWAKGLGMNAARVFLHDVAYGVDPDGFKSRMESFLQIAEARGIRPLFVLFDDCWHGGAKPGPQPEPVPGVHNSRWLQAPGHDVVNDPAQWPRLQTYVQDVVSAFARDPRVLGWDVYNEPGNGGQELKSEPLLRAVFDWVREVGPDQPATAGAWGGNPEFDALMLEWSDVVTFHNYGPAPEVEALCIRFKELGRPVICTEWLARIHHSVEEVLPIFHRHGVGAMNWGFVDGRTQTKWPWGSPEGGPEPEPWFHELLHKDGTSYRESEAEAFRRLAG